MCKALGKTFFKNAFLLNLYNILENEHYFLYYPKKESLERLGNVPRGPQVRISV